MKILYYVKRCCNMRKNKKTIILRYGRNNPQVSPIREHQKVLEAQKRSANADDTINNDLYVLWGLWKKPYESISSSLAHQWIYKGYDDKAISFDNNDDVFLCDLNQKEVYKITWTGILETLTKENLKLIPKYYRPDSIDTALGNYVCIKKFEKVNFKKFVKKNSPKVNFASDSTVLIVENEEYAKKPELPKTVHLDNKHKVIHISDMHFGSKCVFKNVSDLISKFGNDDSVGLIVASGDFSTGVDWQREDYKKKISSNFKQADDFLDQLCKKYGLNPDENLLLCPGNHDKQVIANTSIGERKYTNDYDDYYRVFQRQLININELTYIKSYDMEFINGNDKKKIIINFIVLDSTDEQDENLRTLGYISPRQFYILDYLEKKNQEKDNSNENKTSILNLAVMHHSLLIPPLNSAVVSNTNEIYPSSILYNSYEVISKLEEYRVRCVLHGHQHYPYTGVYNASKLYPISDVKEVKADFLCAGATGIKDLYDEFPFNSYNEYKFSYIKENKKEYIEMDVIICKYTFKEKVQKFETNKKFRFEL